MIPLIVGAALGALKYKNDLDRAKAENQTQSTIAAYSPWTGMQAHAAEQPSLMGSMSQGAATGASMGQSMDASKAAEGMQESEKGLLAAKTNYYNNAAGNGSAGAIGANQMQQPFMEGPMDPSSPFPYAGQGLMRPRG